MVTSNLETFVGEAGAFGELCLPLKNPGYPPPPPEKHFWYDEESISWFFFLTFLCRVKSEDCEIVQRLNHISFCQKKRALDYKLARGDVFN